MKVFKINEKEYNTKKIDFNMICNFEDLGISMDEIVKKPLSATRAYFSFCSGLNLDEAGTEIELHLIKGGELNEIMEGMSEEVENSDFFQALNKKA